VQRGCPLRGGGFFFEEVVRYARDQYSAHLENMQHLQLFYSKYCEKAGVLDRQKFEQDLEEKKSDSLSVGDVAHPEFWGVHKIFLGVAEKLFKLSKSAIFNKVLAESCLSRTNDGVTVEHFALELLQHATAEYEVACSEYCEHTDPLVVNVARLWRDIEVDILNP